MDLEEFKKLLIDNKLISLYHKKSKSIYHTNLRFSVGSDKWNSFWENYFEAKRFLEDNFKTWDRFILCLKKEENYPPRCLICGDFRKVNISYASWYSTMYIINMVKNI